jgi:hypothetical protein
MGIVSFNIFGERQCPIMGMAFCQVEKIRETVMIQYSKSISYVLAPI